MMERNYDYLVNEYAKIECTIRYIKVLKQFGAEVYKNDKGEIDEQLEALERKKQRLTNCT